MDERASMEHAIEEETTNLQNLERTALLTSDPIERARLKSEIESLQRQLFSQKKRLDALSRKLMSPGRIDHESAGRSDGGNVFISYSHRDRKWIERLRPHLKPLEEEGRVDLWDDTRIKPGSMWREEVEAALDSARVVVLLVSADYLASDYIHYEELPLLLEKTRQGKVILLPIIVSPCAFGRTSLAQFQAVNNPSSPLVSKSRSEQEKIFSDLARSIERYLTHDAPSR